MIGELIALVIVVVMPMTLALGLVSALGLAVAGFAVDPRSVGSFVADLRPQPPAIGPAALGPAARMDSPTPSA